LACQAYKMKAFSGTIFDKNSYAAFAVEAASIALR
jgi:hypothetical protein